MTITFRYIGNREDDWYYMVGKRKYPISPDLLFEVDEDWIAPFIEDNDFEYCDRTFYLHEAIQ